MSEKDKDGYLLLEEKFVKRGFEFEFVKNLKGGWKIYKKTKVLSKTDIKNKEHPYVKYELILPIKNEEGSFHGRLFPKRLSYPGDEAFGFRGYDCISLEAAEKRHAEILARKEEKIEQEARKLNLPKDKTFTIKDLEKTNKDWTYNLITSRIRELVEEGRVKQAGEKPNKIGKPSKIYKFVK